MCRFLELVHGPELLEPVENNIVKWCIRCISIFFDPRVVYSFKFFYVSVVIMMMLYSSKFVLVTVSNMMTARE
jgi:hypothetical protein